MAVKAKSVTHGLSHRSILSLDKSNEPFSIQIAEACDILGINLKETKVYLLSEADEEQDVRSFGPQEEWALRWLLKNLQSADLQPASLSLVPKAWLLLRELIIRTPLTNTARLLSAHKFTALLQKNFKWMRGQAHRGAGQSNSLLSWDPAASSSDTIEESVTERPINSRKRKRDDPQSGPLQKTIGDPRFLFASICSTIVKLQAIIDGPTRLRDFAIEHLKSVIRSSPEQAADIFGSSMVLASLIFEEESQNFHNLANSASSEDSDRQSQSIGPLAAVHEACINCIVKIWNTCSASTEDSSFQLKCLVFSVHCMVPTLRFIRIYRAVPHSSSKKEEIVRALEQLLVNNIILPARASYFAGQDRKKTDIEAGSSLSVEALLAPLAKVSDVNIGGTSVRNVQDLSIPAIPLLFSVAVQSLSRNTPRQRSLEDPWLRYLFGQLRNISYSNTMLQHKQHISNLNCMLRGALNHRVRLDSTILEAILAQVMNIADEDFSSPDASTCWALINLCLRINANVFISSPSADRSRNHIPVPNRYLNFLLLQLSSGSWKSSPQSDPNYEFKMVHVIQPLAQAYTNTRDLTTFISHWREQIVLCKQQQNTLAVDVPRYCNSETIWEDEELISQVGRMVEASLTTTQISDLLQSFSVKLLTHAAIRFDSRSMADLVILETIIIGVSKESDLDHLIGDAHSIYLSICSILSSEPGWAGDHSWRLWRILSIFNERWSIPRQSEAAGQAERLAMIKAANSISYAIRARAEAVGTVFATELHAFSFMLKRGPVRSDESELDNHHISSAIQAILNSRISACDHMRLIVDWSRTPPEFSASWNAQNDTIISVDVLVIGCIAQIVMFPAILRDLDTDMQRSFFTQLQNGALAFKNSGQATELGHINYLSLWELMLESELLKESTALSRLFRDLQASLYLEVSSAQVFDIKQYELAFLSIQRAPVRAFERDKENIISRHILQVLLGKCLRNFTLVEDHIALLNGYLSTSHKLQNLLISTRDVFEGESTGTPITRIPLISLAQKLDSELGTDISSLVAFRRLVYHFFRNCASELAQNGSLEYLAPFYDQLAKVGTSDKPYHLSYALSILLERSLDFYLNHLFGSFESMRNKKSCLEGLRQSQSEKVRTEFSKIHETKSLIDRRKLSIVLEGMFSYSDILTIESSGRENALLQLSEISDQLYRATAAEGSANVEGDEFGSPDQLLVQITRVAARLSADRHNPYQAVLETKTPIKELKIPHERRKLLHHLQEMIAKHKKRDATLLKTLRDSERSESFTADYLLLLQQVILAGHKESKQETVDEYAIELDRTYKGLCDKLILPTGYRVCMLTAQCLNLLLQKEPRIISQWHIDNTLAAIAILSSRLEQTIRTTESMSSRPGFIFTGLCRIFSSMLISHRLKLGGRYHLILPALQGLLRCLFSPYPSLPNNNTPKLSSSSSSSSASSPSGSKSPIISFPHASLFSRLLTTLCSPTVSAVTARPRSFYSSFSPSSLNDETKKARSIAGQHLQYLIMEYCTCQLWGHLKATTATTTTTTTTKTTTTTAAAGVTGDDDDNSNNKGGLMMRDKLMPGIFAVMDVMSAEVKRAVNARLDADGRSIFKGLNEEWRREWRWKGG